MRLFRYIKRNIVIFFVNKIFVGTNPRFFSLKAKLLRSIGYKIGEKTSIVGPIICTGNLEIGDNCWIGTNFIVRGNGTVKLGNNIDVGPDVTFITGSHLIGNKFRRAGEGYNCRILVKDGCWIGSKSTFLNEIIVGEASVIASCACVCKDVRSNVLIGGVPARIIKELEND